MFPEFFVYNATFQGVEPSISINPLPIMKKTLLLLLAAAFCLASCDKTNPEEEKPNPIGKTTFTPIQLNAIEIGQVGSDNAFAIDLLQRTNTSDKDLCLSPLSVSLALGMVYNGAQGDTRSGIETALHRNDPAIADLNAYYAKISEGLLTADSKSILHLANSIWTRQGFNVLPTFYEINRKYYGATAQSLDFGSAQALKQINQWCNENTKGKIPTILSDIPSDAIMYLLNAVYFKSVWSTPFKTSATSPDTFTPLTGGGRQVQFMSQTENLGYFEDESVQVVELPYGNGAFNLLVALPRTGTVNDLIATLSPAQWSSWISGLAPSGVAVKLPKFTLEYDNLLNEMLKEMGMADAFDASRADFTSITPAGGIFISKVLHKTYFNLDEAGVEAAAVTAIGMELTSPGPGFGPIPFVADHPFLFAITEKSTGVILFIGAWGK